MWLPVPKSRVHEKEKRGTAKSSTNEGPRKTPKTE